MGLRQRHSKSTKKSNNFSLAPPTDLPISTVVQINITRQNAIPQQVDFGLACFFTTNLTVITPEEVYKIYNDLNEVSQDFNSTTPEYVCALNFFGQNPSPSKIMFACVPLTGEENFVDSSDNDFVDEDGNYFVSAGGPSEDYINAIQNAYQFEKFYMVFIVDTTISNATIQAISAYVETQTMVFLFQSSDPLINQTSTSDIVSLLTLSNSPRTHIDWVDQGATFRQDAANGGMSVPREVGSFNWMFRQLIEITPTSATPSQMAIGLSKFCNYYTLIGGVPCTQRGTTCGTTETYIDQIQAQDWIKINIQTGIFNALVNTPKVPYDNAGGVQLQQVIYNVLSQAQRKGLVEPGFTVTGDDVSSVPPDQRAQRIYGNIYFYAKLTGCINDVIIDGTLAI